MAYNPEPEETRWPAASKWHCDQMAKNYRWQQPANLNDRYEPTGDDVLPVNCVFKGDCQFPLNRMDYTQGDAIKEQN